MRRANGFSPLASAETRCCLRLFPSGLCCAALVLSRAANGAERTEPGAPAPSVAPASPASAPPAARGPGDARPIPEYTGRDPGRAPGHALLWVPRVLFFPLYFGTEYLVRRPLGWLATTAERERWPTILIDFFTFGEQRQAGIIPTLLLDLGLRPTVGIYAFWNDFLVEQNELRLRIAYGGSDAYLVRLTDRFPLGPGRLYLSGSFESRPDNVFRGIGFEELEDRSRYLRREARAGVLYDVPWYRSSRALALLAVRDVELDGSRGCCDDPSVDSQVALGLYPPPPGMNQVYDTFDLGAELVLDTRWPRLPDDLEPASDYVVPPGHGVRVAVRGVLTPLLDQSLAPREELADAWIRYGFSVGGHVDLTGQQRSLGLTAAVDFVDPIGAGSVPLHDLVSLGGERPLRGFLARELQDRSAAALRLEYRWPVGVWMDGHLLYEVGNVFGEHLSGLDLGELRSSLSFGMAAVTAAEHTFQVLIAAGTTSFEDGADFDSFRLVLGTTAGF